MLKKCAGVLLALSLVSLSALAQQFTQLSGTITDPSGATIANAQLLLENTSRGLKRTSKSDSAGYYTFPQIQPGEYKLTAKASGFNDVIVNNITLEVGRPGSINVTFDKIGATSTTVSVSAEGTQVNTTDASVGNVISTTAILELPSFARNLAGLLAFQPGVTSINDNNGQNNGTLDDRNGSVNGGKSDQANVTLDGMDVNQQSARGPFSSVLRSTLDSTQEFRSTTSGATAEFGRSSGAQIQLVTRSGTNDIHGAAYWYHRNTVTAANNFFFNQSGVKRPALLINIPGGRIGGAVVKNKLYYFLNYETRRDASSTAVLRTVPSVLLRQGIVQYRNTAGVTSQAGPAQLKLLDPAGIGVSTAALADLNKYPVPNDLTVGDSLNTQGYRFSAPIASHQNTYITKWDYNYGDRHTFFFRGNLQNDGSISAPQYPGQQPNSTYLQNAKGFVLGHTATISPSLISTFRYGLTRQSFENTGIRNDRSYVVFRGLDNVVGTSQGAGRTIPVHQITQDFAWTKGRHEVKFGGVLRWVTNGSYSYAKSVSTATTNISWLKGSGSEIIASDVSAGDRNLFGTAASIVLGAISQGNANYNYNIDGTVIPTGTAVKRNFKNEEYEWYVSDSWRLKKNLTLTLGLRHSLTPSPYERDGIQLSSSIPLGQFFNDRQGLADRGRSQAEAGRISYVLANSPQGRPLYPFHLTNFSPRAAIAWSPNAETKLGKFFFGGAGKTSIRAGWGKYYDIIGQPLTVTFDQNAFGLATTLVNPSGSLSVANAPRYTGIDSFSSLPSTIVKPANPGGFPATPGDLFSITNAIDDNLQIPYVMRQNFTMGREFKNDLYIEVGYVGSLSRKSLINRDLAMPTNPTDPASKQTYFEAASIMALAVKNKVPASGIPAIPFFENFYPAFAGGGKTATQNIYADALTNPNDFTSVLADIDAFCSPGPCSKLGPNAQFNSQYSALSALSSIGGGSYHAMQATARKRVGKGLLINFNWTWSKSVDLSSSSEATGVNGAGILGGASAFNGFLLNPFNPSQRRAVSNYDQRHIWNAFVNYDLPFGRGKQFGGNANRVLDYLIGGWNIAPTWQMATELPVSVSATGVWPTNWNITSAATPNGPVTQPELTKTAGPPNLFSSPATAYTQWDYSLPGQSGSRNPLRQDGVFNINLAVGKRIQMPWNEKHTIQIRAEAYNVTNVAKFLDPSLNISARPTFGRYSGLSNTPRQMQFAFRYDF